MKKVAVFICCCFIAGCARYSIFPGRPVQQGNIFSAKQVAQLQKGQSRRQVARIMGNPVLENEFTPDQWEYVSTRETRHGDHYLKSVIVRFRNDRVVSIEKRSK